LRQRNAEKHSNFCGRAALDRPNHTTWLPRFRFQLVPRREGCQQLIDRSRHRAAHLRDNGGYVALADRSYLVDGVYPNCRTGTNSIGSSAMTRAGQNNVIIRTDGTVAPCFPMYGSTFDWGNIDHPRFDGAQLFAMKGTCQRHCFSTLNHNLAYCYNDARVMKWLWSSVIKNKFQGGVRSFED
jgi:hypothetical protein